MADNGRFKLNGRWVAHEAMDDEVVIINLNTGNYYSLKEAGIDVWELVIGGASAAEVADRLVQRYEVRREQALQAVEALLATLRKEHLIVEDRSGRPRAALTAAPRASDPSRRPFCPPALERYSDIQGLLYLDPIHDVDETGWPSRKEA